MKKIALSVFAVSLQLHCFCQSTTHYFDKNDSKTDASGCYYFTTGRLSELKWMDTVKSFYCVSLKRKSIEFYDKKGREGFAYYYYENGNLLEKILFKEGSPSGMTDRYYSTGRIKETREYTQSLPNKLNFLVVNAWDSLGGQTVKNYNGHYQGKFENGKIKNGFKDSIWVTYNKSGQKIIAEKYEQGKFIEGDRFDRDHPIHYTEYEVSASPKNGLQALYKRVGESLKYPRDARKKGIQGKVYVKFIIEPDGSISNIEVVKGVDPSLDNEAVRVVRLLNGWNPGYQRGLPIRQSFAIPINFAFK